MNRITILFLVCIITWIPAGRASRLEAGVNSDHKIAVHVVAHGLACKSLPSFTECSQIVTTYADSGDIDIVPVFFNLSEYTVVEFGLTWPAEWGSCAYTPCTPTINIGGITNPGDGIASAWSACQSGWAVSHGYGWLHATGSGTVSIVPNPATGDVGVVDCEPSPGPYYDRPETTFAAGAAGSSGEDPCAEGKRDGGAGFTYTLTIAPGNYLFIYGHEFHGDVVCTLEPGDSLRIGGLPVLPRRPSPPRVLSEQRLSEVFGRVPFVQERVREGDTWLQASEAFFEREEQMRQGASRIYLREVERTGSRELAEQAALDSLDRSLLDPTFAPRVTNGMVTLKMAGSRSREGFQLGDMSDAEPPVKKAKAATPGESLEFLKLVSMGIDGKSGGVWMELLTHGGETRLAGAAVAKALRQIEGAERGNEIEGPLSADQLESILATRRGPAR